MISGALTFTRCSTISRSIGDRHAAYTRVYTQQPSYRTAPRHHIHVPTRPAQQPRNLAPLNRLLLGTSAVRTSESAAAPQPARGAPIAVSMTHRPLLGWNSSAVAPARPPSPPSTATQPWNSGTATTPKLQRAARMAGSVDQPPPPAPAPTPAAAAAAALSSPISLAPAAAAAAAPGMPAATSATAYGEHDQPTTANTSSAAAVAVWMRDTMYIICIKYEYSDIYAHAGSAPSTVTLSVGDETALTAAALAPTSPPRSRRGGRTPHSFAADARPLPLFRSCLP
eukprot:COSAG01_NODE_8613_length_2719_cov_59.627863_2_plen_283_part_00